MRLQDPNRPPFTLGVVTEAVISVLDRVEHGTTVSYEAINAAAKCDVRRVARHALSTARKVLLRDKGKVFVCVKNVGFRLLENAEISPVTWRHNSDRIRNVATLGSKQQMAVKMSLLPPHEQCMVVARASALTLMRRAASSRTVQRFLPLCTPDIKVLPMPAIARALLERQSRNGDKS